MESKKGLYEEVEARMGNHRIVKTNKYWLPTHPGIFDIVVQKRIFFFWWVDVVVHLEPFRDFVMINFEDLKTA